MIVLFVITSVPPGCSEGTMASKARQKSVRFASYVLGLALMGAESLKAIANRRVAGEGHRVIRRSPLELRSAVAVGG